MKFELRQTRDWSYFCLPELEKAGIVHGFFTQASPSNLLEGQERNAFLDAFALNDSIIMSQQHGDDVYIIKNGERPASGDGLVLLEKGVAGIIKTADCLPIIICDFGYPVASIIHSGWRGTVKRIAKKAVRVMSGLGAKKAHMVALFGPAIESCCYEVKEDVYRIFRENAFPGHIFHEKNGTLFLDMKKANREILSLEGIEKIYDVGLCTFCNENEPLFHSYRRGETKGRQVNFVSIRG